MSFTIKCDVCGKEQKLVTTKTFNDENISIYPDIPFEGGQRVSLNVECLCGNEIYETT